MGHGTSKTAASFAPEDRQGLKPQIVFSTDSTFEDKEDPASENTEGADDDISPDSPKGWCGSDDDLTVRAEPRYTKETLIIFDWDDTLLCTTAINAKCCVEGQLHQLARTVYDLLMCAMSEGDTIIVTNGKPNWVKESCRYFFPSLWPTINRLKVISARERFEHLFPGDPFAWKRHAFKRILQQRSKQVPADLGLNLIVLGDSLAEIEAAFSATDSSSRGRVLVKAVKFRATPSCGQLIGQLRKVKIEFDKIVKEGHNVSKILVARSPAPDEWAPPNQAAAWKFVNSKVTGHFHYMRSLVRGRPWIRAVKAVCSGQASSEEPLKACKSFAEPCTLSRGKVLGRFTTLIL